MANGLNNIFGQMADRRAFQRWARLADAARNLNFSELKAARGRANALRQETDRLGRSADAPMSELGPKAMIEAPGDSDWRWRPEGWRCKSDPAGITGAESGAEFASGISVFHDCKTSELTLRQVRNHDGADLARFGIALDVRRFDGTFLSLALDLPQEALSGLSRRHLIGVAAHFCMEKPIEIFARLNIRHGPNTEQLVRKIPADISQTCVEFDLAYCELNERRLEKAWLDLIFEGPEMNEVEIRDLTMYRRPRAEF